MKRRLEAHQDSTTFLPRFLSLTFPSSLTALPSVSEAPRVALSVAPSGETQGCDPLYKSAFCPNTKALRVWHCGLNELCLLANS